MLLPDNVDPDQTPHYVVSDLGLRCLSMTILLVSRKEWVNIETDRSEQTVRTQIRLLLKILLLLQEQSDQGLHCHFIFLDALLHLVNTVELQWLKHLWDSEN